MLEGIARMRLGSAFLIATVATVILAESSPAESLRVRPAPPQPVAGEVIVVYEKGATAADRRRVRASSGVDGRRRLRLPGAEVVEVVDGRSVSEAVARLERSAIVRSAEPNRRMRSYDRAPNDPLFASHRLWGLHNDVESAGFFGGTVDADIDAPEAWDVATGGSDVTVAVVDEGVQYQHPDLAAHMWVNADEVAGNGLDDDANGFVDDRRGWDFVDGDNDPMDLGGHGTHVAGTIGAIGDNGVGLAGVSWNARLMPVRALGPDGGTDAAVGDAFDYAADNGADVVNASLGRDGSLSTYQEAVIGAHPDVLFVFAAGNGGQDGVGDDVGTVGSAPCASEKPNVICVAATNPSDALSTFSNFGATTVDLAAPGEAILSAAIFAETFADDFEDGVLTDQWSNDGFALEMDGLGGFVRAQAADASLATLAAVDVTGKSACFLEFAAFVDAPGPSSVLLEKQAVSGAGWESVASISDTPSWKAFKAAVTGSHRYRFSLDYDGVGSDRVELDDVAVRCAGVDAATSYTYSSGTSMATPHVAGAAAVLRSLDPGASAVYVRSLLLAGGDGNAILSGKTVTGRRLNLRNAIDAATVPTVVTGAAGEVTTSGARLSGTLDPNALETSYVFEYGTTTAYGSSTPAASAGAGAAPVAVSAAVGGLVAATTYHYRLVAVRGGQRFPGVDMTFTTGAPAPPPPAPPPLPPPPSVDRVAVMKRTATVSCRRRNRTSTVCRFRAEGARSVRGTVENRRGRTVGRFRALAGSRTAVRVRGLRRGARYTFTMTFTDPDGNRAKVRRRLKIR